MMFYTDKVDDTRQMFFSSWSKYRQHQLLSSLEQQIVDVIKVHSEYHELLESPARSIDKAYFPELGQNNPFLHMGFHLAIRDQVATDRPPGIKNIYQRLIKKDKDALMVEHLLMDHLAECLWQAQRSRSMPDEASYIRACRGLL